MSDHEDRRKQLWADAAVAYLGSGNEYTSGRGAVEAADRVLQGFDSKFEAPEPEPEKPAPTFVRDTES